MDELDEETIHFSRPIEPQLFESTDGKHSIHFPLDDDNVLHAQVMLNFHQNSFLSVVTPESY